MEPAYKIAQRLHERRAAVGLPKYGRHLDADSHGCMLVHALEESADKTNYLIAEVQRRREALELLIPLRDSLEIVRDYGFADTLTTVIDLLGGEAALAKYDEILGGGIVAENATVATDPRDEALRVAAEALQLVANNTTASQPTQQDPRPYRFLSTGQSALIHTVFSALDTLDAIRAAGGAR